MQTTIPTPGTIFGGRRRMPATAALALLSVFAFAQTGLAQTTPPLNFGNNYFVTGDYVVGGVGLRGLGDATGFATGTINIPDANSVPATGVPAGAQIVGAILYWGTVESSSTAFAGQHGFFRPVFTGGPSAGYPITGLLLGNPNAPTSWSSGGCSGSSQGSKTMRVYRADVRAFLPQDSKGNILAGNAQAPASYEVRLADSGSNGGTAPLTLGATLVIIYRVISPNFPLNSVVIYDGAFAPSNSASTMTQTMQGFYKAAASPVAKLTHIVGNGQSNKFETVSLNNVNLPSLYGSLPPFPGNYNGSWDNPTWIVNNYPPVNTAVPANDSSPATTMVVPSPTNSGCVSWGAVILGTTVQNSDNDGILDVWKQGQNGQPGYCDASVNGGVCGTTDPSWVALPGATPGKKDIFVELDYMCSIVNNGVCDTTNGYSFLPSSQALTMMSNAFSAKGINLHLIPTNAIQEQTYDPPCADNLLASPPILCPYLNQPGMVGWKAGFEFLKNQPLNLNPDGTPWTEAQCEQNPTSCVRRFQHGRKDSYHYALFGHALGRPQWSFLGGSLTSVVASGNTVTFTTSTPHGLVAGTDRVTIADAITNSSLNRTYFLQSASGNTFTIQIATAVNATYTPSTDPRLSLSSGRIGTGSGFSDVGGADTLVTLGLWGAASQIAQVQAGTFMHELGHSLALTHGGFYYDTPGSYKPTVEPNCKPNFQSVMSYLFQVDLLDNGVLDYSEQKLSALDESSLPGGVTTTDGSALVFSTTKWYTPIQPGGIGTAATHHCDGTPLAPTTDFNPTMYRVEGAANPITPAWVNDSDINFNGKIDTSLRGYNDWTNIDLRQIGATGSDILGGGGSFGEGAGSFGEGAGSFGEGAGSFGEGAGSFGEGAGSFGEGAGSGGSGEITLETANSVTRPPRNLTASVTSPTSTSPRFIQLNWMAPTFGLIGSYNIYRAVNGTPAPPAYASVSGSTLTFTDKNVVCGPTYTYFVTAVLAGTNPPQESVPSNSVSLTDCAPPYNFNGFLTPLALAGNTSFSGAFNQGKSVPIKWQLKDSSGNFVSNLNVNTLGERFLGPAPPTGVCPLPGAVSPGFDQPPLFSPTTGAEGNSTFRYDTTNNQFIFNWDTKPFSTGCYVIELDLDSGQVERTALKLQ